MHEVFLKSYNDSTFVWEERVNIPFNELILSWNAKRPNLGGYRIFVSLLTDHWTEWMKYAYWGVSYQNTFKKTSEEFEVNQDRVDLLNGTRAKAFKVKVLALNGATLDHFRSLHASTIDLEKHIVAYERPDISIELNAKKISQMALQSPLSKRICSPASVASVINTLFPTLEIDPLELAKRVLDNVFNLYGNWVLNVAEASHLLGPLWSCHVEHLAHFNQILIQLKKGFPVVVSVKGTLKNSPQSYPEGHLLVVHGYDSKKEHVHCMDPAFPTDDLTTVSYEIDTFLNAWRERKGLAYIFNKAPSTELI